MMRTAHYERWHPVRTPASGGQADELFSLKFCISVPQMAAHERDPSLQHPGEDNERRLKAMSEGQVLMYALRGKSLLMMGTF